MAKSPEAKGAVPKVGEGRRGMEGYLLYLLRQANTVAQQAMDRALAELGLSVAQYSALTMIKAYQPLSSADLARLSMLTPQSAHEVVQRLDGRGLIRKFPDPHHRRIVRLEITDAGQALIQEARKLFDPVEERLLAAAGGIDPAAIRQWLVAVATGLAGNDEA